MIRDLSDADRIPVIIGVGQINDRPAADAEGLDSLGLMRAALTAAELDSGVPVRGRIDWLGVVDQISFPDPDIHEHLAEQLPRRPAHVFRTREASGDGPVRLINDAANAIGRGDIRIAAAVGAEALRTASARAKAAASTPATAGAGAGAARSNSLLEAAKAIASPLARQYGLLTPTDVYPLYENATRSAWGQSLAEAQAESAAIWSGMSHTAAANPHAWLRKEVTAETVARPSADNRVISFPYTKLMVANGSVNQGAAVILASLAMARELGVAEPGLVYVGAGAAAEEDPDYLRRESFTESASLNATIDHCLRFNGLDVAQLDCVELYSCFPCIPKMARRRLGWPLHRPHSVYGGLTFGGGPIGNCMMHAIACMVDRLRERRGNGLIVANGGFATHSHSIVLTTSPTCRLFPQDYSVQAAADKSRGARPPLLTSHVGRGRIETYSVPYDRAGAPLFATIVGRTPDDARFLAHVEPQNSGMLDFLTSGRCDPVGAHGRTRLAVDGRVLWDATIQR
jgi:acetyl-CoA C-acetyltransferase